MIAAQQTGRLNSIDALRGMAAFLVMAQHIFTAPLVLKTSPALASIILAVCTGWFDIGKFGVLVFFAISGYVIPFSFKGENPIGRFLITRYFRLYPAYWLSIFGIAALSLVQGGDVSASQILINMTMVQRLLATPDLIGVYWTLFVELVFYVLCCVAMALGMIKSPRLVIAAILAFSALLLVVAGGVYVTGRHLPVAPVFGLSVMYMGTLLRLAQVEGDRMAKAAVPFALPLVCIVQVLACYLAYANTADPEVTPWYGQSMATIAAMAVFVLGARYKGPVGKSLIFFGAISYSLYLMHEIAIRALTPWFTATPLSCVIFVIAVSAASVTISWLVFRFVEQPFIAIGKRMSRAVWRPRLEA